METTSRLRFLLIFVVWIGFVHSENDHSENTLCRTDLTSFIPFPYSNLPNMICKPLWNSYLLRYSQSKDHEITIVLSTIYTSGWVGIGFSRDGKMINSSCMVGWINSEGHGKIKQFHLKGLKSSEIKPDSGELPLTNAPPYVALQGATIYLAFQLKFNSTLKNQPVLLAFSTKTPHHHRLNMHDDKKTIYLDFSSGKTDSNTDVDISSGIFRDRKTHGTLAILAWGFFLPVGAIVARYLKHRENLWYYLHVSIQFLGFLLGVAGVVVGLSLDKKLHAFIPAHKGIGIFVFVVTILQVFAFIARPGNDSKYRRYWNWYHGWAGRAGLFLAAVNIVLGIHVAGGGQGWRVGYGFLVGSVLVAVVVLEALNMVRERRRKDEEEYHSNHNPPFSI